MQVTASLKFVGLGVEAVAGKVSDNARPHPGPLPQGEGETVAASLANQAAGLVGAVDECSKNVPR